MRPTASSTRGCTSSICCDRYGVHEADSLGLRIAIVRRPALQNVRDVDLGARQSDRAQHRVQELPRAADERLALPILVGAGRLADHEQARVAPADAEHRLRAASMQRRTTCRRAPLAASSAQTERRSAPASAERRRRRRPRRRLGRRGRGRRAPAAQPPHGNADLARDTDRAEPSRRHRVVSLAAAAVPQPGRGPRCRVDDEQAEDRHGRARAR